MPNSNAYSLGQHVDILPGRNRVINGGMLVQQRGTTTVSGSNSGAYGQVDRFTSQIANSATGAFTLTGSVGGSSFPFNGVGRPCLAQTVTTVAGGISNTNFWSGIQHRIEGYNCYDLIGQQITLSFLFATNVAGTYSVAIADGAAAYTCVQTFTATASVQKIVLTFPTLPGTLTMPASSAIGMYISIGGIASGTTVTSTIGSWVSGNFAAASGSINWATVVSNYIAVAEMQLEVGTVATPFEREPYNITLAKCQRYYAATQSGTFVGSGAAAITTSAFVQIQLQTAMRASPTIAFTGTPQLYGPSSALTVTSFGTTYASGGFLAVTANVASGLTVGTGVMLYTNNGIISFNAEL